MALIHTVRGMRICGDFVWIVAYPVSATTECYSSGLTSEPIKTSEKVAYKQFDISDDVLDLATYRYSCFCYLFTAAQ